MCLIIAAMTITVTVAGGPPKRQIVEMAYSKCALSGYEFGRTPEEVNDALTELNAMMYEWPFCCLGYVQPSYGVGEASEESGIPSDTLAAVATQLALRLAPNMGKTLSPEAQASVSRSMALLHARAATVPTQTFQKNTVAGLGRKISVIMPFINETFVPDPGCVIQLPTVSGTPAATPPPPPPPPPPPSSASLQFNVAANSQYVPLVAF